MKILIADDNQFFRLSMKAMLLEWEFEVVEAHDGLKAWEILKNPEAPAIALIDWMMPGLNGLELCKKVRALPRPEPVYLIMLTSLDGKENRVKALNAGADDFMHKPFDRDQLQASLQVGKRIVGMQTSHILVFTFARAVEARCSYTRGHSERVTQYALALAAKVGLPDHDVEILRRGALLHDIGKISVPDAILNKPEKLTPEEYAIVQMHPVWGEEMVQPLQSLQDVLPLIRWHHERLDGKGYPDGLAGKDIPFPVRLLSVADVYDALKSERPYRPAMDYLKCLEILRQEVKEGSLDYDLVELFASIPQEKFEGYASKVKSGIHKRPKIAHLMEPTKVVG